MKYSVGGEGALENDSRALARYLAAVTTEDQTIYNLGFQSEIYYYADRRAPTRFLFDHPFAVDEKYEIAALQDLTDDPPAYIVDSAVYEENRLRDANYYPVLIKQFTDENYDCIGRLYYADIYRLVTGDSEGSS